MVQQQRVPVRSIQRIRGLRKILNNLAPKSVLGSENPHVLEVMGQCWELTITISFRIKWDLISLISELLKIVFLPQWNVQWRMAWDTYSRFFAVFFFHLVPCAILPLLLLFSRSTRDVLDWNPTWVLLPCERIPILYLILTNAKVSLQNSPLWVQPYLFW